MITSVLSDLGTEIVQGIISWQFLQFVVTFLSVFGLVLTGR